MKIDVILKLQKIYAGTENYKEKLITPTKRNKH